MTLSLDFAKLKPLITDNTLVLTPNARTQQAIYSGQMQSAKDSEVISPVNLLTFSQWQNKLWEELSFIKILPQTISKSALILWIEEIISNEPEWSLTNVSGVARKVIDAYQNLIAWDLSIEDVSQCNELDVSNNDLVDEFNVENKASVEVCYFIKWMNEYIKRSQSKKMICHFEQLHYLLKSIENLFSPSSRKELNDESATDQSYPQKLLLVGFDQFTPLEKKFLKALANYDVEVQYYNYEISCEQSNVIEFDSIKEELDFSAYYANRIVESERDSNVVIVVNQLGNHLETVFDSFSQVFQPEESKPWVELSKPLFNVSAGFTLADQSIVKAGSLLLNLRQDRLTSEELHFIKNTHYLTWGDETQATKYFLHQLCLNARRDYKVKYLLSEIEKFETAYLPLTQLKTRLKRLKSKQNKAPQDKAPSILFFIKEWKETLKLWGWGCCEESFDSITLIEKRAGSEFVELFNSIFELSGWFDRVSEKQALQYLNQLAVGKSFQQPSDRTRVHILGVLEATGLQFEHMILVGFNSANWPVKNNPNPFLPVSLQKTYKLPGGSPEREFDYTKSLSVTLIKTAREIIATSSDENNDTKSSASHFFMSLEDNWREFNILTEYEKDSAKTEPKINEYQWIKNSQLNMNQSNLNGGVGVLSQYAVCPFKSMLNFCLKVSNFEMPDSGIDARQRGVWLHDAMYLIWLKLKKQSNLITLDNHELQELVEECLSKKLAEIKNILLINASESIIALEKEKLSELILEWLSIEKEREDFSIKYLEKEMNISILDIEFNFRIDRVDSNYLGEIEIIDYKTGKVNVNDWFSARPEESQMPAYYLAFEADKLSSINYAKIKRGEVSQVGLKIEPLDGKTDHKTVVSLKNRAADHLVKFDVCLEPDAEINSKVIELKEKAIGDEGVFDSDELKLQWRKTLERISYGLSVGFMPVSPKDKNTSCRYCQYSSVCRINERQPEFYHDDEIKEIGHYGGDES